MAKNINYVSHKKSKVKSNGKPQLPSASALVEGEIAINYAENVETLSIKNESGTVVTFSSDNYYTEQKLGSGFTGVNSANTVTTALNELENEKLDITDFNTHTGDTSIHHTHSNKAALDSITGTVGTMAYQNTSSYSSATQVNTALGNKVDKVSGKGLSTNDFTTELKNKLDAIASGAEVNVQADWTEIDDTSDSFIKNKPTLGTAAAKGVSNGITNSDNLIESKHIYSGVGVTVAYDSSTHYIQLKSTSGNVLSSFDASSFLVDGMVDSVTLESKSGTTYLVIEWNTAAGKTKTELNIGDIFEADNYLTKAQLTATTDYTTVTKANSANTASTVALTGVTDADDLKAIEALTGTSGLLKKTAANTWSLDTTVYSSATQVNTALSGKSDTGHTHDDRYYTEAEIDTLVGSGFTSSSITDVIISDEKITSAALNDLNENKLDASAYTPTDLSDYYTKGETSGASQISTALNDKASNAAFTAHTASTVHMTTTEKTNLDSLATNIGAISGITSAKVTSWDNAVNDLSALTADVSGQSETVAAALNVLNDSIEGVDVVIEQKTKVTAIALNDLDDRIVSANNSINGLSDNVAEINNNLGGLKFKCLTQQEYNTLIINDEIDDFTLYITIDTNGYDYVEIGGIKWATMNVGATAITDTGLYFQWGDTSGYTASQVGSGEGQKYFSWADYKFNPSGDGSTMTKYNSTDGLNKLKNADDSVRANMGGQWRMPTEAEFQSLINATTTAWTSSYEGSGVAGIIFTDKNDNSKVLFFPAAGYCSLGSVNNVGSYGNYWSSSLNASLVVSGRYLGFDSGDCDMYYADRYNGFSVRGVVGQ